MFLSKFNFTEMVLFKYVHKYNISFLFDILVNYVLTSLMFLTVVKLREICNSKQWCTSFGNVLL